MSIQMETGKLLYCNFVPLKINVKLAIMQIFMIHDAISYYNDSEIHALKPLKFEIFI